jgi:hypothetical protein
MWGLKMISFLTPKVLAEGQTSGSGGWVKKLALITMKAMIDDGCVLPMEITFMDMEDKY